MNQIPFAAIDRVEVLKDGASAIYGSDAVAGVVNVILKRDYQGDQVRLRGQQVMDAMRAQWPTVRTLVTYGPWVSEPATYQRLSPVLPYNDISFANELEGSFVVGMTSQVSDVAVASRSLRRLTLIHGVLAFLFNIAVLALSINTIASAI